MRANTNSTTTAEKGDVSNGQVDARVGRALSEFLHAEKGQHGDQTYRVHSGSGKTYAVDLDNPDGERFCSCPDETQFCKHILHVLLVETPETLVECKHGSERCPGVEAISVEEDEPTSEGNFPCFKCFMEAYREHKNTESEEEEDTPATETGTVESQPVMADGGQEVTDVYRCNDEETLRGKPVYVHDRMTGDEMRWCLDRAEDLLDELEGYPVESLQAYGSRGLVGVRVKPGHDPLRNGIITSGVEGFRVVAIRPESTDTVYIRFQKIDRDSP